MANQLYTYNTAKPVTGTRKNDKNSLDVNLSSSDLQDAFGRLRTSGTAQRLDVEFLYDKQSDYFDEITTNGTVTYNVNGRDLTLSISDANNGTQAKMASYPVPYTPGNSQLVDITGVLDLAGIGGGTAEVFLRSNVTGSVVETTIAQENWLALRESADLDFTKSHIFSMDFQSLKVGTIRYGFVQDGVFVQIAQINNDNTRDSGYWQIPNLPVYYDLYNSGGETFMEMGYGNADNAIGIRYKISANASATMKAICCTVKSEGGLDLQNMTGLPVSTDTGVTTKLVSTTLVPIISIKPAATFQSLENLIISLPRSISVATDQPIKIVVIHSSILTGASFTAVDSNTSCMEVDTSATAMSNGHEILSQYITASGSGSKTSGSGGGLLGKKVLWNRQGTDTGILTVAAIRTGGTDADVLVSINWEELR